MFLSDRTVWPYAYRRGDSPLVVSMPHAGTYVPPSVARTLNDCAVRRPDTDWHLPRLYDFLDELGATVIAANYSRYVVDVNRPPDGANLYPGRDTPRLCPTDTFDRQALYRDDEPAEAEIARRVEAIWRPYHARLRREVARVRDEHGIAMVWDAHSIVSVAPRLFEGRLADFNLGTADGSACDPALARSLLEAFGEDPRYTAVHDGRFKGGYITRAYGDPAQGVHAIQLEMAESVYMDEAPPFTFREAKAARARPLLRGQLERVIAWALAQPRRGQRVASRRV